VTVASVFAISAGLSLSKSPYFLVPENSTYLFTFDYYLCLYIDEETIVSVKNKVQNKRKTCAQAMSLREGTEPCDESLSQDTDGVKT